MPIIGIPTMAWPRPHGQVDGTNNSYVRAIRAAGGTPFLLPVSDDRAELSRQYEAIDGLLLSGGGDVSPVFYGAQDSGKLTLVDRERDVAEITLISRALTEGMPILAICRGIQILNVAAGGTLVQDIPTAFPTKRDHSYQEGNPRGHVAHTVSVEPGSRLAQWLGDGVSLPSVEVNSMHHQLVERVAEGFRVVAQSDDGLVESIELSALDHQCVVGVQWHPEEMVPAHRSMVSLFASFVQASASWRAEP